MMTSGGVVPGGRPRTVVCTMAVTWAQRSLDVGLWAEENLDDADPVYRLRLNVLDVVHRDGDAALGVGDNTVRHVLRAQTRRSSTPR